MYVNSAGIDENYKMVVFKKKIINSCTYFKQPYCFMFVN